MVIDLTGCYISALGREVLPWVTGKDRNFVHFPTIPELYKLSLNISVLNYWMWECHPFETETPFE